MIDIFRFSFIPLFYTSSNILKYLKSGGKSKIGRGRDADRGAGPDRVPGLGKGAAVGRGSTPRDGQFSLRGFGSHRGGVPTVTSVLNSIREKNSNQ